MSHNILVYTYRSVLFQSSSEKILPATDGKNTETHSQTITRVRDLRTANPKWHISKNTSPKDSRIPVKEESEKARARGNRGR